MQQQSNDGLVRSPNNRIVTPDNQQRLVEEPAEVQSTPKSRRKRKPNVTKKVESEKLPESEILQDLRTDYSEKDMDIENDICSSERISEVCSPTTNSIIEKNVQVRNSPAQPLKSPIVSPQHKATTAPVTNNLPHRNLNSIFPPANNHQDSDECETIDKIAEMVSDLTSKKSENTSPPVVESPKKPINYSSQNNQEKLIDEVETRLEEMFADTAESHEQSKSNSEETSPQNQSQNEPKVEKEIIESITIADVPKTEGEEIPKENGKTEEVSESNGPTKKTNNKNGSKKGPARRRKANNAKNKGKNKKKGKMSGNVEDLPKELKALAQRRDMNNGKVKQKSENLAMGPILQIQKDGSFNIVNQSTNGDEDGDRAQSKTKNYNKSSLDKSKVIRGMFASTLNSKYNAEEKDATWVCVFCKLGPHKYELGDLFGPYIISKLDAEYQFCLQDPKEDLFRQSNANKLAKKQNVQAESLMEAGPSSSSSSEKNTQVSFKTSGHV